MHNRKSHDIAVHEIAIENGECEQHVTKTMDGTYTPFVAVLLGIICDHEHHLSQTWNASQLRWAKSHEKLRY